MTYNREVLKVAMATNYRLAGGGLDDATALRVGMTAEGICGRLLAEIEDSMSQDDADALKADGHDPDALKQLFFLQVMSAAYRATIGMCGGLPHSAFVAADDEGDEIGRAIYAAWRDCAASSGSDGGAK